MRMPLVSTYLWVNSDMARSSLRSTVDSRQFDTDQFGNHRTMRDPLGTPRCIESILHRPTNTVADCELSTVHCQQPVDCSLHIDLVHLRCAFHDEAEARLDLSAHQRLDGRLGLVFV